MNSWIFVIHFLLSVTTLVRWINFCTGLIQISPIFTHLLTTIHSGFLQLSLFFSILSSLLSIQCHLKFKFSMTNYQMLFLYKTSYIWIVWSDNILIIKAAFLILVHWTKLHISCHISNLILLWALFIRIIIISLIMCLIKLISLWSLHAFFRFTEIFQYFATVIYFIYKFFLIQKLSKAVEHFYHNPIKPCIF